MRRSARSGPSSPIRSAPSSSDLDIQEYTDPEHDPMIPHTLVLKPGLVVHSIYNGYWFWGRPSVEDLRQDLRAVTARDPPGLGPEHPGAAGSLGCRRPLRLPRLEQVEPRTRRGRAREPVTPEIRVSMIPEIEDGTDHVRGPAAAPVVLEYGDYECPFSRKAFRAIERRAQRPGGVRFAFRHFPLTEIHPHALAAAAAAEAAAQQARFWEMHELLFHRQKALEDDDLRRYAEELGLDAGALRTRPAREPDARARRSRRREREASGEVRGTPTLFIDGVVYRGDYDVQTLLEALSP